MEQWNRKIFMAHGFHQYLTISNNERDKISMEGKFRWLDD